MISKFIEVMRYFAEQSVKKPENGAVSSRTKTLLEDYDDLVAREKRNKGDVYILTSETTVAHLDDLSRKYAASSKEAVDKVLGQTRQPWPTVWMNVARAIAQRSYDPRLQVGCIIIPEDNTGVLSLGYNGNAMGLPNEVESLEPGKSGFIHAEMNALIKCDYNFGKKKHMYVTHVPCPTCSKLIIQGQIARVIYGETYRDSSGIDLLKRAGIEVLSYDEALITHQT